MRPPRSHSPSASRRVPSAGGVAGDLVPPSQARSRRQQPRKTPARALDDTERERVLDVLASPRFVDRSPAEVVATLLDEGQYLCSERTMYRILVAEQPVRERRNQLTHPRYTKPELLATASNQTWSWDITRLLGPKRWTYFHLYVLLDIFSRYVVGWMSPSAKAPRWPAGSSSNRASSKVSSLKCSPCTPTAARP